MSYKFLIVPAVYFIAMGLFFSISSFASGDHADGVMSQIGLVWTMLGLLAMTTALVTKSHADRIAELESRLDNQQKAAQVEPAE